MRTMLVVTTLATFVLPLRGAAPTPWLTSEQRARLKKADQLNGEIIKLYQRQKYAEALTAAKEALSLREQVLGKESRVVTVSRTNLALLLQELGRHSEALPESLEAVRVARWIAPDDDELITKAIGNLSLLYQRIGEFRKSLPLTEEALQRAASSSKTARTMTHVVALNNLTVLHRNRGEPRRALPIMEEAIAMLSEIKGDKDATYGTLLNNLASLYHDTGEMRRALLTYDKVMDYFTRTNGTNRLDYALVLTNLGNLYQEIGEWQLALQRTERAFEIFRSTLGEKHSHLAITLNNLGSIRDALNQNERARECYEQAREWCRRYRPDKHVELAIYEQNLGFLAQKAGRFDEALKQFTKALELRKNVIGEQHPESAKNINNLAIVFHAKGDHDKASELYQKAADLYLKTTGDRHVEYAISTNNLATSLQARGHKKEALKVARQSLESAQNYLEDTFFALSDRQKQRALQVRSINLEVFLGLGVEQLPAADLYHWVATAKAAVLARPAEERLAISHPELKPMVEELRDVRALLARHALTIPTSSNLAPWRQRFDQLEQRKESIQAKLSQISFDFSSSRKRPTVKDVADALPKGAVLIEFIIYDRRMRPKLGSNGWELERQLLAFVISPQGSAELVSFGNVEPIEQAIRQWRQAVTNPRRGDPDPEVTDFLRRKLWLPLEEKVGDARTVLLAPDGELANLPFAALPGKAPESFLLESYVLGYVTSGRQLVDAKRTSNATGTGLLTLGGVDFGARHETATRYDLLDFIPLPGTAMEIQEVAALFDRNHPKEPVQSLTGKRANRDHFLRTLTAPGRWRFLHLGTHGQFEEVRGLENPRQLGLLAVSSGSLGGFAGWFGSLAALRAAEASPMLNQEGFDPLGRGVRVYQRNPLLACSLALAGANDSRTEGLLTAEEIASLDLRGCELATLSACDTGLGRLAGWQGVQGLQSAFHEAGAQNVLASLWGVSDSATSVLMNRFYEQLWEKKRSPLEALREAQLSVLRNPQRIEQRAMELKKLLAKSGQPANDLSRRGIGRIAEAGPARGAASTRRSPVAWWGAWVMSGAGK